MKKVLIVISTLDTGGAQRAVSNITTYFSKDWDIDILLNDDTNIAYPYRGNIISLGFKPREDKTNLLYQLKVILKRISTLKKLKKTGEYSACVSFLDSANFANILSGNKYCKTVVSVRSNLTNTAKTMPKYKYIVNPIVKLLYNRADYVEAASQGSVDDLRTAFHIRESKLIRIYNGYNHQDILEKSKEEIDPKIKEQIENNFTVVTMGRLGKEKGQNQLVRAFALAKKERPDMKLLFLGDGPMKDTLYNTAVKYGVQKDVIFAGFLENPHRYLPHCDVFVFPSLYEGFPNALAEAMICGLPVISSDCESGVREIIAPDTPVSYHTDSVENAEYGILIPVGDASTDNGDYNLCEKCMAKAISAIAEDDVLRENYSKLSVKRANDFSISEVVKQWEELLK